MNPYTKDIGESYSFCQNIEEKSRRGRSQVGFPHISGVHLKSDTVICLRPCFWQTDIRREKFALDDAERPKGARPTSVCDTALVLPPAELHAP